MTEELEEDTSGKLDDEEEMLLLLDKLVVPVELNVLVEFDTARGTELEVLPVEEDFIADVVAVC